MLRVKTETGWWLITHPDHARLAARFAQHWGNGLFARPGPRAEVLHGISVHDDGWMARDAHPSITREGKPSAFSHELVGKYSAFEEIDLVDYLAVRENALANVEAECPYAALLVSMHTYNLLTARADRSTIAPGQLPVLDAFLTRQLKRQQALRVKMRGDGRFADQEVSDERILANFRLLQATDNLSLLGCVGYASPATLLHRLELNAGEAQTVDVQPIGPRAFRLTPYPFEEAQLRFEVPARHVEGNTFASSEELVSRFVSAPVEPIAITVSA